MQSTAVWQGVRSEMKSMKQRLIFFIILVLLAMGMTGCAAEAGEAGTGQAASGLETEAVGIAEQVDCQKWSRLSKEKNAGNREWEDDEAGTLTSATATLSVTDHRADNAAVREYADREAFLREYGFDGQEPYFEYVAEDGVLQLELYCDWNSGLCCGLRYYPGEDMELEGFLFNGSNNDRYYTDFMDSGGIEADRYSVFSFYGGDGKGEAEEYEESAQYREDGRLEHYISQGWIPWLTEKKEIQKILEIEWSYREDGTLRERDYWHNGMIFGTWYSSRQSYYDEQERLVHERCYVTHGSVEYYYIYVGESETPLYCLILDDNTGLLCGEMLEYHGTGTEDQDTEMKISQKVYKSLKPWRQLCIETAVLICYNKF
ncbi:MAG: hypothetical protein NC305_03290 [Lachnospiraceae bacterium]|nr:hypothetical protein [Butyrivibrio sp.]MCM1343204.1 hypothetical protein [Muribaculaceae bacterium]MCM1409554.1 hypothetical protein [Lachnospiraceae bacterium]